MTCPLARTRSYEDEELLNSMEMSIPFSVDPR